MLYKFIQVKWEFSKKNFTLLHVVILYIFMTGVSCNRTKPNKLNFFVVHETKTAKTLKHVHKKDYIIEK